MAGGTPARISLHLARKCRFTHRISGPRKSALNTLGNYAEQLWGEDLAQPGTDAISRALADVEEAFEAITGGKQLVEGLHEAWGPAGRDYAKSLADCWNGMLKAKLARHAYIDEMPHYGFDFPPPAL